MQRIQLLSVMRYRNIKLKSTLYTIDIDSLSLNMDENSKGKNKHATTDKIPHTLASIADPSTYSIVFSFTFLEIEGQSIFRQKKGFRSVLGTEQGV